MTTCGTCHGERDIVLGWTPRSWSDPGEPVTTDCPTCDGSGVVETGTECPCAQDVVDDLLEAHEAARHAASAGVWA